MLIQWQSIQNSIQHLIHSGLNFVSMHPHWGFFFAFLIAFTESLPIIGTIIPGSITMTAIGTLIGAGLLPTSSTLGFAILGAFAGDGLGYYLGYTYNKGIRQLKWVKNNPHWLEKGERFFECHGGKSILIGRFIGPIRSTIPMIAGLLKMKPRAFIIAAIPSAILWSILYTTPGIALGALAMDMPKGKIGQFIFFGLLLITIAWSIIWCIEKIMTWLYRHYRDLCCKIWEKNSNQVFRWLNIYGQTSNDINLRRLITLFCCITLFLILWVDSATGWGLARLNWPILYFLRGLQTPNSMKLFAQLSLFGNKFVLIGFVLLISSWWLYRKDYRAAITLSSSFLTALIAVGIMKIIFYHPRPSGLIVVSHSSSFPSGHVSLATTCYFLLAYLLTEKQSYTMQQWAKGLAITLISFVALSRLFLGMHWLCDVLAGFCLGIAITSVTQIIDSRNSPNQKKRSISIALIAISIPWLALGGHAYHQTLDHTQLKNTKTVISIENWWENSTQYIPLIRFNRLHQAVQPLNIQWLGNLKQIKQQLRDWKIIEPSKNNLSLAIKKITHQNIEDQQGLLQPLYHFRAAALEAYYHHNGKLFILQLWPSCTHIINSSDTLWVGNLSLRQPSTQLFKRHQYLSVLPKKLLQYIFNQQKIKITQYNVSIKIMRKLNWNGQIALIKQKKQ